jgi:ribokinase
MKKILVFGPARTVETLTVPALGTSAEGTGYETVLGGQGETLAVALARLGARSVYCGRVGDDSGGKRLVRLLDAAGVDLSGFRVDRTAQTGHLVREVAPDGERRLLFAGAERAVTLDDVSTAFLTAPEAVCVTGEVAPDLLARIGELAGERGIPLFMLYTGGVPLTAIPTPHVFMTDEATAAALTGVAPSGVDNALKAVIELDKTVKADYYVIRQGDRGVFLYDRIYCHLVSAFIVPQVDTRGCDEAFFAAAVCEYLTTGSDLKLALRYGAAAAAIASTRVGEAAAMPTADEVLAFLERS